MAITVAPLSPVTARRLLIASIASAILGAVGLVLLAALASAPAGPAPTAPYDYGIVLDAGSTHTRLAIYSWPRRTNTSTSPVTEAPPITQHKWYCDVSPGATARRARASHGLRTGTLALMLLARVARRHLGVRE